MTMDSTPRHSPNTPSRDSATLKELLRSRHQTRNGVRGNPRSCLPCRERKVKCDKQSPCSVCKKRGHADLCDYGGSTPQSHSAQRSTARSVARVRVASRTPELAREDIRTNEGIPDQHWGQTGQENLRGPSVNVNTHEDAVSSLSTEPQARDTSDGLFLADTSVVNMIRRRSIRSRDDSVRQSAFETGILPLLGVTKGDHASMLPYQSLPSDQEIVRLFEHFRRRVHPFHVILYNLNDLEEKICRLINNTNEAQAGNRAVSLEDSHWLSLLHAVLAAGAQFSDMNLQQRTIIVQRHSMSYSVHCNLSQSYADSIPAKQAFDLLRSVDYVCQPSKEAVQALLLLGNVLQNDMKPQAAWVLGGTTIRLAQCLGLHKNTNNQTSTSLFGEDAKYLRLSIVWQDCLLALASGRPPASYEFDFIGDLAPLVDQDSHGLSYVQAMGWLSHVTLPYLATRSDSPNQPILILNDIKSIESAVAPYLIDLKATKSISHIQEHYAFELHRHFVISTLFRPFMSRTGSSALTQDDRLLVLGQFQESLKRSVRAYVRLRAIAGHARRSWAFIHNGLTSILLLSLMRETRHLSETRVLQDEVIASLSEGESDSGSNPDQIFAGQLSGPLQKALQALKTLRALADRDTNTQEPTTENVANQQSMPGVRSDYAHGDEEGPTEQENFWGEGTFNWDFAVDFDMSPMSAFDYIMSDQALGGFDSFVPNM